MLKNRTETLQVDTISQNYFKCFSCDKLISGSYYVEDGFRYLKRVCSDCNTTTTTLINKENGSDKLVHDAKYKKDFVNYTLNGVKNDGDCTNVLLFLTHGCNSHCTICYDTFLCKKREDMSLEIIENTLKMYKNKIFYLFGGEPTTREDLPEIIRLVKSYGHQCVLFTNGLKLADKRYLTELMSAGLDYVNFSFDGFNKRVYDKRKINIWVT